MGNEHKERNGGKFTACALCRNPDCLSVDVHDIRLPNPEPPRVILAADAQDEILEMSANGAISVHYIPVDRYDRWDERGFEVVRICNECGYEWGQT